MLEVRLIGTFEVKCDGRAVSLPSRFAQSLLAFLILNAGTSHRREKLAGMFWPESSDQRARASLRYELWRLRKSLACLSAPGVLITDDLTVRIEASTEYQLDVKDLIQIESDAPIEKLIAALAVYTGELLPGFYDDWLVLERERLQTLYEQRMTRLLQLLEAESRWAEMVEWAERWLAMGQKPEAAFRSLIVAYAAMGDRVKVLESYERCKRAFQELGFEPSEEVRSLAEARQALTNLPMPLTALVGRDQERREVAERMLVSRLVTLTGSGGVGKTRLSTEVARDTAHRFPDGVWFLELAPLEDPSLVPTLLVSMLRISPQAGASVTDMLKRYFLSRNALLILDNCEHLIGACAQLALELVSACPGLHILATSREALRVPGEAVYRVPSLAVPAAQDLDDPTAQAAVDSVRLFVERGRARASGFDLTTGNLAHVSRICIRLDGIPLAIELAAGRLGSMTLETILQHLDDRFALLTGGLRTDLPRHQTLHALIDWSHELLSEPERQLLRRLAVFAGGWTIAGAQQVAGHGDLREADVLRLLPELVEKSLVILDAAGGRYRMLETVRFFALQQLQQAGEENLMRTRHLDFILALVARSDLRSSEERAAFADLLPEHENILSALGWCDRVEGGVQKGLQIVGATNLYWKLLAQFELGASLARHVLGLPGAGIRNDARRRSLHTLAQMVAFLGRSTEALEVLEESLGIAEELQDRLGLCEAHFELGSVKMEVGPDEAAMDHLRLCLSLAEELNNDFMRSGALCGLGECLRAQERYDEAESVCMQALELERKAKSMYGVALMLNNLAMLLIQRGDLEQARGMLLQLEPVSATAVYPLLLGQLFTYAGFMAASHEWHGAARTYGSAEAHRAQTGEFLDRPDQAFIDLRMAQTCSALGAARYAQELEGGARIAPATALAQAEAWLRGHP